MELKLLSSAGILHSVNCSNRTFMELKRISNNVVDSGFISSNRTFMELKLASMAVRVEA